MKYKYLILILFALIVIGILYVTTLYAQELQSFSSNNVSYQQNVYIPQNQVNILYQRFKGTYNNSKSFSFDYPKGWNALNVNQLNGSEVASFGLNQSSVTVNVYLKCQNISKEKGKNVTLDGYKGIENITREGITFYSSNFNIDLVYNNSYKVDVFDHIIKSLKLYNGFSSCSNS